MADVDPGGIQRALEAAIGGDVERLVAPLAPNLEWRGSNAATCGGGLLPPDTVLRRPVKFSEPASPALRSSPAWRSPTPRPASWPPTSSAVSSRSGGR
jgi:hypothetical protein